jgi:MFS family permease
MPEKPAIKPVTPRNPRLFYGYVIVAACVLILFMIHGPGSTFGVFFNSLQSEFGWSRTILSGASAVGGIMWGTVAVFAGRLTDRFGPKLVISIFCFIMGIGYIAMSQVSNIWQIYLFLGILVTFGNGSADVIALSTTARWFTKRRGIMSGIVKVGTGAGLMIVPLVATHLIESYDWRRAYLIIGNCCPGDYPAGSPITQT